LFRAGLVSLLGDMPEFEIVGEAGSGEEALELADRLQPDVILLDVNMPGMDGVATMRALHRMKETAKVIMLTISRHDEDLIGAIQAGAEGYILKNAEPEELRSAILRVARGQSVLSPEVTHQVLRALASAQTTLPDPGLSRRELEVLGCLAHGKNTTNIASELFVSENTVKTHVRHILEKLEAANRAEAVSKAIQMGLIKNNSVT
jgi:two-component system, NarL family, nitrate/nitrite response regulator NarL